MKTLYRILAIIYVWCALVLLSNCTINHHYKRINHHKEKLLSKGETFTKDTIHDTIKEIVLDTLIIGDTVYITKTITNTVTLEPEIIVKDRWRVKYETRYKYKSFKVENKAKVKELTKLLRLEREKTKQVKAEQPIYTRWWFWLILLIFGLLVYISAKKN